MKQPIARFPDSVVEKIRGDKILGIRAGKNSKHRVIGVWVVVVDGCVFVRSYQSKADGWWQTLVKDPHGQMFLYQRKRGINFRAAQVKSDALKEKVSAAYKEKYNTPGSAQYVKEMSRSPSRDATMELVTE